MRYLVDVKEKSCKKWFLTKDSKIPSFWYVKHITQLIIVADDRIEEDVDDNS